MCGIVGIAEPPHQGRYTAEDVSRMAGAIVHRGPDDEGVFVGDGVILGMRRLSIIDLEGGHQPIPNEDQSVWVVNNGEIYNYRELRDQLVRAGHRFRTNSDTEVIVHAYEEFGDAFVERLEGMFGLALWDSRKSKLVVARDRLGIKPVYYMRDGAMLAFGSEIKSLLRLPGIAARVDQQALFEYTTIGYAIAPRTIFEGVRKLEPATVLTWHAGNVETRRYWSPPLTVDEGPDYETWVEAVRAELQRAVRSHMVADVPVGAFLSGGIDSSAVVALMASASDAPINTYSIGYRGSDVADYYNELPYARTVAEKIGTHHREIRVQPDVARLLPKLIWHLEEPISDSAITTTYLVSELAAQSNKVIQSGVGGDELFAGYNRYLGDHYDVRYRKIPGWARRRILPRLASLLPSGRQNRLMDMARYAKRFITASELDWRERYALYLSISSEQVASRLLKAGAFENGFDRIASDEHGSDGLLRLFRIDWQTQLAENLLLLTDKMTMAVSLECRVPFLDHRLVELAARIPAHHKLPRGRLKGLLKDALSGVLPDSIINRRKRGFGAPVGAWLKDDLAPLRELLIGRHAIEARGHLDYKLVAQVCRDHDRHREDFSDLILVLMNFEIWSRLFLDGQSHEDVAGELAERGLAA